MTITLSPRIQHHYSESEVIRFLCNYQVHCQYARTPKREDVLTQKMQPLHEGPYVVGVVNLADMERAVLSQGSDGLLLFMVYGMGKSSWNKSNDSRYWRDKVCNWWGIEPNELRKRLQNAMERVLVYLNGG